MESIIYTVYMLEVSSSELTIQRKNTLPHVPPLIQLFYSLYGMNPESLYQKKSLYPLK